MFVPPAPSCGPGPSDVSPSGRKEREWVLLLFCPDLGNLSQVKTHTVSLGG